MIIENIFEKDINRKINGVIKVEESIDEVIREEVDEYVITTELKKHFELFFKSYAKSFLQPETDIGVWISGFFGSGKSHFLKMLSYILADRNGYILNSFKNKLADSPKICEDIDKSTCHKTETILFNIDAQGSSLKDNTAVLKVFAKMFYKHLGFFGENMKIARLEKYLYSERKLDAFKEAFLKEKGKEWESQRGSFAFNKKHVVNALVNSTDMTRDNAEKWFDDKKAEEFSIDSIVKEIKDYVDSKEDGFRLLFMIDEVGQYIGTDTNHLLNLQTIVERLGSDCRGKVWVMCTGQEAIDKIIKVRTDEFSRIQARFKIRLSLSSSSADEVIKKRVLNKTPEAYKELKELFEKKGPQYTNLFAFEDTTMDIKGYQDADEFASVFPCIPYQFRMLQNVFTEIRTHGNSGNHMSHGERSMLSGFQEAILKIKEKDECTIVPFHYFYDTVKSFLESDITRVIQRCEEAGRNRNGIEPFDAEVLKLLFLIKYIDDDIPAIIDNITVLMSSDIRPDKSILKERVEKSLNRLVSQNYIRKMGFKYSFMTNEEQDVEKEIRACIITDAEIQRHLCSILNESIITQRKFNYCGNDFDIEIQIDSIPSNSQNGELKINFVTPITCSLDNRIDITNAQINSIGKILIIPNDLDYYDNLENYIRLNKYLKGQEIKNISNTKMHVLDLRRNDLNTLKEELLKNIKAAIKDSNIYVDTNKINVPSGDAKDKINYALGKLALLIYKKIDLIKYTFKTNADILQYNPIMGVNKSAEDEMLEQISYGRLRTVADIQSKYQKAPYGWKEIDIAGIIVSLLSQKKITVIHSGVEIKNIDDKLIDYLRKKTETPKTSVTERKIIDPRKLLHVKTILKEYFINPNAPSDEDKFISWIIQQFEGQIKILHDILMKYDSFAYPDKDLVEETETLFKDIVASSKISNSSLIDTIEAKEQELFYNRENVENIILFFKNQAKIFKSAVELSRHLSKEKDYLKSNQDLLDKLNKIDSITRINKPFNYNNISRLNKIMAELSDGHKELLVKKQNEISVEIDSFIKRLQKRADYSVAAKRIVEKAIVFLNNKKAELLKNNLLSDIDAAIYRLSKHIIPDYEKEIDEAIDEEIKKQGKLEVKNIYIEHLIKDTEIRTEADIDEYVNEIRKNLKIYLQKADVLKIQVKKY